MALLAPLAPYESRVIDDALVAGISHDQPPADAIAATQAIRGGEVHIALRRHPESN